jgi:hypothetical protein
VISIATPSRNVQGRVGPTHAEMTVIGPTVSIIAGCLHFFQLVERHEVHAIHGTGLLCEEVGKRIYGEQKAVKSVLAIQSAKSLP